jgi:hypothetical protein
MSSKTEDIRCNVFLHVAGAEIQKIFSTWTIPDAEQDKIDPLKACVKAHCEGKKNLTIQQNTHSTTPTKKTVKHSNDISQGS